MRLAVVEVLVSEEDGGVEVAVEVCGVWPVRLRAWVWRRGDKVPVEVSVVSADALLDPENRAHFGCEKRTRDQNKDASLGRCLLTFFCRAPRDQTALCAAKELRVMSAFFLAAGTPGNRRRVENHKRRHRSR